jgi:hypothetical protein
VPITRQKTTNTFQLFHCQQTKRSISSWLATCIVMVTAKLQIWERWRILVINVYDKDSYTFALHHLFDTLTWNRALSHCSSRENRNWSVRRWFFLQIVCLHFIEFNPRFMGALYIERSPGVLFSQQYQSECAFQHLTVHYIK